MNSESKIRRAEPPTNYWISEEKIEGKINYRAATFGWIGTFRQSRLEAIYDARDHNKKN